MHHKAKHAVLDRQLYEVAQIQNNLLLAGLGIDTTEQALPLRHPEHAVIIDVDLPRNGKAGDDGLIREQFLSTGRNS